jgi:alkanesulfonate monooxygenase SsuD/methylene tetrahydromethanopterin reductase-like flavin-dependent oxidoreductase (luciferase family)
MHGFLIGADEADLRARAGRLAEWTGEDVSADALRGNWLAGTPDEVVARLREYEAIGVERVMLQHHLYRDHAALELIAAEVVPAFS